MAANWMRRTLVIAACASAALLSACGSSSVESAISPNRFVVFGDGLADSGQSGAAYSVNDGSINNWTVQLASRYGVELKPVSKGGWNYAQGNARVTQQPDAAGSTSTLTVTQQIDKFLSGGNAFTDGDLVVISAGVGDMVSNIMAYRNGTITQDQLMANADQAGADLAVQVRRVVAAGAKHVIVTGTYDVGRSPWATAINLRDLMTSTTLKFNDRLKVDINSLGGRTVLYMDIAYRVNLFQGSPGSFGMTDSTNPVCTSVDPGPGIGIGNNEVNSLLCNTNTLLPQADQNRYVFADKIYLAPYAQRQFGDYVRDTLVLQW